MTRVEVGQVWSMAQSAMGGRVRLRVTELVNTMAVVVDIQRPKKEPRLIPIDVFEKGARASKLEQHADGSRPGARVFVTPADNATERRSAGEMRRTFKPKGGVSELAQRGLDMIASGETPMNVAARLGVSPSTVSHWRQAEREMKEGT